jgi:hypothetical protein
VKLLVPLKWWQVSSHGTGSELVGLLEGLLAHLDALNYKWVLIVKSWESRLYWLGDWNWNWLNLDYLVINLNWVGTNLLSRSDLFLIFWFIFLVLF